MGKVESAVERYLIKRIKRLGGQCYKWRAIDNKGVPDRIAVIPGFGMVGIEVKSSTGKLSPIQSYVVNTIKKCGGTCVVVYGRQGVDTFISSLKTKVDP
jgi:Holliday junction resolvase